MLTLGQAAKEAGVSKTTISRAVKSGRISASRNDKGEYNIDPAELFRVYPRNGVNGESDSSMERHATVVSPPALTVEIDLLKEKLRFMEEQNAHFKDQISDLRDDRDSWRDQARASQLLLTDGREKKKKWFGFG